MGLCEQAARDAYHALSRNSGAEPIMNASSADFFQVAIRALERVRATQHQSIATAGMWVAESIRQNGVLHIFGAGHSHLFGEEATYRAGGLAPVNAILDIGYTMMAAPPSHSTRLERLEGYALSVLANYDLRAGEVFLVMSQSGINPGPVEAALEAKALGLRVVAVSSLEQSRSSASRHSSGKRLFEVADLAIDNLVPPGDASLELRPDAPRLAPLSTIVGAAILHAIVVAAVQRLLEEGIEPPVWMSSNVPGGDEHNARLKARYASRRRSF
jgi:uncharacterized phosphosugar-binding protein